MKQLINKYSEIALVVILLTMVCITRISMAAGNILYALALLIGLISWIYLRKKIYLTSRVKSYCKAYSIMLLLLVPSIFASDNIVGTVKAFMNIWLLKVPLFLIITSFIKQKRYLIMMLTIFLYYIGIDSLSAFFNSINHINIDSIGRSGGLFNGSVMGMAMVLTMVFPVSLIIMWDTVFPKSLRLSALFSTISVIFGMFGNQSRGSWVFTMGTSILVSIRYFIKRWMYLVLAIMVVSSVVYNISDKMHYITRLESVTNTTTDGSNLGRIYLWTSTIEMIKDKPLLGVGTGQWKSVYDANYRMKKQVQELNQSHNTFLQIASESGVIGFIGYIFFTAWVLFITGKGWLKDRNPYDLSVFICLFSYLYLFGSIDYTLGNSSGVRIMWFIIGVMTQLQQIMTKNEKDNIEYK